MRVTCSDPGANFVRWVRRSRHLHIYSSGFAPETPKASFGCSWLCSTSEQIHEVDWVTPIRPPYPSHQSSPSRVIPPTVDFNVYFIAFAAPINYAHGSYSTKIILDYSKISSNFL